MDIPLKLSEFKESLISADKKRFETILEAYGNFTQTDQTQELLQIASEEVNADFITLLAITAFENMSKEQLIQIVAKENFDAEMSEVLKGLCAVPEFNLEKLTVKTENYIKLMVTLSRDVRVIIILLIDRLRKLRHLNEFDQNQKERIATEVQYIFSPVAHRIGLYKIKTEMEEICLKYFDYASYRGIADKLQIKKTERDKYIADFIEPLKEKFQSNNLKFSIKGRPKSISSIRNKMKNQNVDVDAIYDLFAIRIILDSKPENEKADCWKAYSLITEEYKPNPYRLRDWISVPKSSGYESLHTTVIGPLGRWVEVQIRTVRMDETAEKGLAAHWKYKNGTDGKDDGNRIFSRIREALETSETSKPGDVKKALYSDEIYIFTPDGDLIRMHKGDTVLDFAYSIHSEVGNKCIGAQLNNKFVSIKHVLQNGDTAKILTNNNQKPSPEWINVAHNQRVKNRIRRIVTGMQNRLSEIGKDIVRQKLTQAGFEFNDVNVGKLVKHFDLETGIAFYQAVGEGKIDAAKIKKAFDEKSEKPVEEVKSVEDLSDEVSHGTENYLVIDNLNTIDYTFAKCCRPLPGDKIFAFVTVNKGTKIHRIDCPNASSLVSRYPYRVIDAVWKKDININAFNTTLTVEGVYEPGIDSAINDLIAKEFYLHIRSLTINRLPAGKFSVAVSVNISGQGQLFSLVERLKRLKNVERVIF